MPKTLFPFLHFNFSMNSPITTINYPLYAALTSSFFVLDMRTHIIKQRRYENRINNRGKSRNWI
jgi:hypothetical protein